MSKSMVPLIDLVFLTLGSVLAAMTQMERVESIPVEVARVGTGAAAVQRGAFDVVSLTPDGLTLNGEPIASDVLEARASGKPIVLRAHRDLPTQRTLETLGRLARAGAEVSLEVRSEEHAQSAERPRSEQP